MRFVLPVLSCLFFQLFFNHGLKAEFHKLGEHEIQADDRVFIGGSFNPPTLGHAALAVHLSQVFGFTDIRFRVTWKEIKESKGENHETKKGEDIGTPALEDPSKEEAMSLFLTKALIRHFDEVLKIFSIPYKNFKVGFDEEGQLFSTWVGKDGRTFRVLVDETEIRHKIKEDTIGTLEFEKNRYGGDVSKTWWVSGGDFNPSKWKVPNWIDLFDLANHIVIKRPGFEFSLTEIFGKDYLHSHYQTGYDTTAKAWISDRLDGGPDNFVLEEPSLRQSSTENRFSIAQPDDHDHAQDGLSPSVFRYALERGAYGGVLTIRNIERYLLWQHPSLDEPELEDGVFEVYRQLAEIRAATIVHELQEERALEARREARKEQNKLRLAKIGRGKRILKKIKTAKRALFNISQIDVVQMLNAAGRAMVQQTHAFGHGVVDRAHAVKHHFADAVEASKKLFVTTVRKHGLDVAIFAAMYPLLESIELAVGGSAGAAIVSPWLISAGIPTPISIILGSILGLAIGHPVEIIGFPLMGAYVYLKYARKNWRKADPDKFFGDPKMYAYLKNYDNQILQGDALQTEAHVRLNNGLGLGAGNIHFNIMKSLLPKFIPLSVRQMYDRWIQKKTPWQDLDLTSNEFAFILGDKELVKRLIYGIDDEHGHHGHHHHDHHHGTEGGVSENDGVSFEQLFIAANKIPEVAQRLDIFLGHRYIKRLIFGGVRNELFLSLNAKEREFVNKNIALARQYHHALEADQHPETLALMKDALADFYLVSRMVQREPGLAQSDQFWATLEDFIATNYPGKKYKPRKSSHRREVDTRLNLLGGLVREFFPEHFETLPKRFKDNTFPEMPNSKTPLETLKVQKLRHSLSHYVRENLADFTLTPDQIGASRTWEILKKSDRLKSMNGESDQKFVLDLHNFLEKEFDPALASIREAQDKAFRHLKEKRDADSPSRAILKSAAYRIEDSIKATLYKLEQLKFRWLRTRKAHHFEKDETKIPGHDDDFRPAFEALKTQLNGELNALRRINHMMWGTEVVHLSDRSALRERLAGILNPLGIPSHRLGLNLKEWRGYTAQKARELPGKVVRKTSDLILKCAELLTPPPGSETYPYRDQFHYWPPY